MSPLRLISIKAPILCHHHRCDKYVYDCQGDNKHSCNCLYQFWPPIIALEILQLGFCFKLLVKVFLFVSIYKVFWLSEFFRACKITNYCRPETFWGSDFLFVREFTSTEIITFSRKTPALIQNRELSHKGWTRASPWSSSLVWTNWSLILWHVYVLTPLII